MSIFDWLENTRAAIWVGESLYAYPFWLTAHAVGMAMVVGILWMLDMRLLGLFKGLRPSAFLPVMKVAWIGFLINGISGVFLFISQATTFVHSKPFLIKISCIFVAFFVTIATQKQLRRLRDDNLDADGAVHVTGALKVLAVLSMLLWLSAIISGRLIAYL